MIGKKINTETEEHIEMKRQIMEILEKDPLNKNVTSEYRMGDQIADVYCEHAHLKYVIECQCSHISKLDFEFRTTGWESKGVYFTWIFGHFWFALDNGQIVLKKQLLKKWKYINWFINDEIVVRNKEYYSKALENPFIKPYINTSLNKKRLIFIDFVQNIQQS